MAGNRFIRGRELNLLSRGKRRRIGLLGGSFNPAHDGHRHISLIALRRLRLDEVWWLVSPQNPLKPAAGMATLSDRVAEAQSVARHPNIHVSPLETELNTQYTADTLKILRQRCPGTLFVWLMGADNLSQLPRWRDWTGIMEGIPVAVFARPTYSLHALAGKAACRYRKRRLNSAYSRKLAVMKPPAWCFLTIRLHPASATEIRRQRQVK